MLLYLGILPYLLYAYLHAIEQGWRRFRWLVLARLLLLPRLHLPSRAQVVGGSVPSR